MYSRFCRACYASGLLPSSVNHGRKPGVHTQPGFSSGSYPSWHYETPSAQWSALEAVVPLCSPLPCRLKLSLTA